MKTLKPLYCLVAAICCGMSVPVAAAEPVRLTDDGRLKRDPVVWPDGKSIVFNLEQPSGRMKLVRLDLATKKLSLLHADENLSDRELTVSGDGNVYAYNLIKGGPGIISDLWAVRIDPPAVIKLPAEAQWSSFPSVSGDGKRVVFAETGQTLHLFEINFDDPDFRSDQDDGSDEKKRKEQEERRKNSRAKAMKAGTLWQFKGDMLWPRLSPDGQTIAYGDHRGGDFEIFAMNADGTNARRLTKSPGIDARPAWSPDGKQIAFTSNRDGNHEIYVMNADGSEPRRMTNHPERDDFAAWHPNGRQLVFVGEREGSLDLYSLEVHTK
jgi:Tol biopolymer transport system component